MFVNNSLKTLRIKRKETYQKGETFNESPGGERWTLTFDPLKYHISKMWPKIIELLLLKLPAKVNNRLKLLTIQ